MYKFQLITIPGIWLPVIALCENDSLCVLIFRYAMGKDYKLYLKFVATHQDEIPNIAKLVTQWRFREFKPFFITKAQQQ